MYFGRTRRTLSDVLLLTTNRVDIAENGPSELTRSGVSSIPGGSSKLWFSIRERASQSLGVLNLRNTKFVQAYRTVTEENL